jgi:AraC-like DNA-binding protein
MRRRSSVIAILRDSCTILQNIFAGTGRMCRIGYDRRHDSFADIGCRVTPPRDPYQEMASIITRFTADDGEWPTAIGNLFLARRSSTMKCTYTTQWPFFGLVVQGAKSMAFGSHVQHYGVGDYLVVSLDLPVASRVTQASPDTPNLGLGIRIEPERLKEVLGLIGTARPAVAPADMRAVAVNKAPPDLLDAVVRLMRLLDRPEDIAALAPLIEREILYRVATGPHGPALLQIATIETPSNRIVQAVAWLRQNFTRPLRIEELAQHVGMSASSLHHHFKALTAMTPMQYQKQLRLFEARRLMLAERLDVGSAGYSVGYQSPSQFSREYSRLYGRPPLRDIGAAQMSLAVTA